MLNKNEIHLLEDFSDYNRFPILQPIDDWLHVNERFLIIIDHRNNTTRRDVPVGVPLDLSTPTGMSCIGAYGENCRPAKSPDLGRRLSAFSLHCRLSGFDVHFTGEIEKLLAFFFFR